MQYTRTISRMVTNPAVPSWRTAMTATDTLYEVGGLPANTTSTVNWPAAGSDNLLMSGGLDGNSAYMHSDSYGSSVFVDEIEAYGAIVFGTTGETCITNQLTIWKPGDDVPAWEWFQQPEYALSSAQADTMNADAYYNEAEYAALAISNPARIIGYGNEIPFSAGWDHNFPVGYVNWIIRRKFTESFTGSQYGDDRPHYFRGEMPVYVPASMTGTGSGAIIVTSYGTTHGPFAGHQEDGDAGHPYGTSHTNWFADVWPSGRRKKYLWAMNVTTKAWTRLPTPLPDMTLFEPATPMGFVDVANKRIYYLTVTSTRGLLYVDLSAGLAGLSFTGPTAMTLVGGDAGYTRASNAVLCVPTSGALAGKRLAYTWAGGYTGGDFVMVDIDTGSQHHLAVTGMPTTGAGSWRWSYNAAANRVYIVNYVGTTINYYTFTIPDNYTNAASYVITQQSLTPASGVTVQDKGSSVHAFGAGRSHFNASLGVIFVTQNKFGKMLAFRPS